MKIIHWLGIGLLVFANFSCDRARMSRNYGPSGAGHFGNKPQCDTQVKAWTLWLNDNKSMAGVVKPFKGELSVAENYGYEDLAAHIDIGPKGQPFEASHFLYEGPDGLYFFFTLDKEVVGSVDNQVDMLIQVSHNDHQDSIAISDEPGELEAVDADRVSTYYRGLFRYKIQSDGGVIGPLVGDKWEVRVSYTQLGQIIDSNVYSEGRSTLKTSSDPGVAQDFVIRGALVSPCQ